jgi:hypothetical protein
VGLLPLLEAGRLAVASSYGHPSDRGRLAYDPRDRLAITIYTNERNEGPMFETWGDLDAGLRTLTRGRSLPTG